MAHQTVKRQMYKAFSHVMVERNTVSVQDAVTDMRYSVVKNTDGNYSIIRPRKCIINVTIEQDNRTVYQTYQCNGTSMILLGCY